MPAREGHVSELEAVSVLPLPWLFCLDICRGKCPLRAPLKSVFFDCWEYGW